MFTKLSAVRTLVFTTGVSCSSMAADTGLGDEKSGIIPGDFTHKIARAVVSSLLVAVAFSGLGRTELSPRPNRLLLLLCLFVLPSFLRICFSFMLLFI